MDNFGFTTVFVEMAGEGEASAYAHTVDAVRARRLALCVSHKLAFQLALRMNHEYE